MEINEHIIQFSGKASVEKPLELDHDYKLESTVTCRKISTTPNDNGTIDITYKVEPTITEIITELGETLKTSKKGKQSVAMRFQIISWMRDNFPDIDDEEAYQMAMTWLMTDLPNILTWLKKKYEA